MSYTGNYMTKLREAARRSIARALGADPKEYATIFVGNGCTGAVNQLVDSLDIGRKMNPRKSTVVFLGPYEHNSNYLPWKESAAKVVKLPECPVRGGVDMHVLEARLRTHWVS